MRNRVVEIPITCGGPDECYYLIEGEESTEQQVSEFLLKPLFREVI